MNILYVVHNLGHDVPESKSKVISGGCEAFTYQLSHSLSTEHTCYILYPDMKNSDVVYLHKIHKFRNELIEKITAISKYKKLSSFSELLDTYKIDVVHYQHLIHNPIEYTIIAKSKKIKQILTIHDYFFICQEHFLETDKYVTCNVPKQIEECIKCQEYKAGIKGEYVFLRREAMTHLLRTIDKIFVPSKSLRTDYFKIYPELNDKLEIAPIGISPTPSLDISKVEGLNIGIRSYFMHIKGVLRIMSVLKACEELLPDVKFHILTETLEDELKNYLSKFKNIETSPEKIGKINLAWLPTLGRETFSILASEFLFMGIPILSSSKGALKERLENLGFLYSENANTDEILLKIKELRDNPKSILEAHTKILEHRDDIPTLDFSVKFYNNQYKNLTSK